MEEQLQRITLFDVPMLFSNGRIDPSDLPDGIYRYDLRGSDLDPGFPILLEEQVTVNHAGTILSAFPLDLSDVGRLRLGDEMGFDGGLSSVGQYVKEMASHGSEMEDRLFCAIGRANENLYLSGKGDKYAIYQLRRNAGLAKLLFMSSDYLAKNNLTVEAENYDYVYGGRLPDGVALDDIYDRFNRAIPDGYTGHSLSVSDIVVLQQNGKVTAHYVDNFGFYELEKFVSQRQQIVERLQREEDASICCLPESLEQQASRQHAKIDGQDKNRKLQNNREAR